MAAEPYVQKNGSWVVDLPVLGEDGQPAVGPDGRQRRKRHTLGHSENEAMAAYHRLMLERLESRGNRGGERRKDVQPAASQLTIGELVLDYVEWCGAHLAAVTMRTRRAYLAWLVDGRGALPADRVTPGLLDEIVRDKLAEGLSRRSCSHFVSKVKTMYRWAVKRGLIERNPVEHADRPSVPPAEARNLSGAQVAALFDLVAGHWPLGPFCRLLLLTGLRRGELAGCTWDDYDAGERTLLIRHHKTERHTGMPKVVGVSDAAAEIIEGLPRYGEYLFSQPNGCPYDPDSLSKSLRRLRDDRRTSVEKADKEGKPVEAVKRVSLDGVAFHNLRHTFASLAFNHGLHLEDVGQVLGHSSTVMTRHYVEADGKRRRRVADVVAAALDEKKPPAE